MNKRRRFKAHRRRALRRVQFRCVTGQHTPYLPGLASKLPRGYVYCRHCCGTQRFTVTGPPQPWMFTVPFNFTYEVTPNGVRTIP